MTRDYNLAAQAAELSKASEALAHNTPPSQKQVLQHESILDNCSHWPLLPHAQGTQATHDSVNHESECPSAG